ncbi:MAG TPA: MOSC N-terminal beta barrel domain-containing protein [Candidatus Binataceae bacterium]|nr:MOSC N-terminal beta barrel domain-containing protein [Candidatus Binataceae bacterium]
MERRQIGVVKELFRYPVKSMLGERLERLEIGERGVIGDRAWALRERDNGKVVSAKKFAQMLDCRATYEALPHDGESAPIKIQLPAGQTLHAADGDASAQLSALLGRPMVIERAKANQHTRAGIDPGTIFGDVPIENVMPQLSRATMPDDFSLVKGTFFDSATLHILATGTLDHMRALVGEGAQIDARRFRPNIVVDTGSDASGFVEDEWNERTLEVGESVKIVALTPALRCVMTTHRQEELARDLRIIRAAAQFHRATVGVFASVGASGAVRVGDPVFLSA